MWLNGAADYVYQKWPRTAPRPTRASRASLLFTERWSPFPLPWNLGCACDCSDSLSTAKTLRLARLSYERYGYCLAFSEPKPLQPSHHVVRKPQTTWRGQTRQCPG